METRTNEEIAAAQTYHINIKVCYHIYVKPTPFAKSLLITATARSTLSFRFIAFEEVQGPKKMIGVLLVRLQVNGIVDQQPNKLNNIGVSAKVLHKSPSNYLLATGELIRGNSPAHKLPLSSCRRMRHHVSISS